MTTRSGVAYGVVRYDRVHHIRRSANSALAACCSGAINAMALRHIREYWRASIIQHTLPNGKTGAVVSHG